MLRRTALLLIPVAFAVSCSAGEGDPPAPGGGSVIGNGLRIRQVRDPNIQGRPQSGAMVRVTGAVVLHVDTHEEVRGGRGTIWIQDVGAPKPYSGISLFAPSFVPADLRLAPGDVLTKLQQLAQPVATFRYEHKVPDPIEIDPNDLNDYEKGRQWLGMLVKVKDITIDEPFNSSGRVTAHITPNVDRNAGAMSNELYDIASRGFTAGTKFKSITGIVTWFFSYKLAPRSAADLEQ
jgi:hypothetical protein